MVNANCRIPVTVITGFLGAGKTTLIRHLLQTANGVRLALVINEFGDLGIDGEILKGCGLAGCREDDVLELANGCICCTVADDFIPALETLLDRAEPPQHIVIETSGLALPKPLIRAFNWPEIRTRVTIDGVVAVIDGPAVAEGRFAADPAAVQMQREGDAALDHENPLEEVFEDQLACADLVVMNKADLMDRRMLSLAHELVAQKLRPEVKLVRTTQGAIDARVLLGLNAAAEQDLGNRPSHHDGAEDHDHDDFTSLSVEFGVIASVHELANRLKLVIARHDILRIKGFAAVAGRDMRLVVQCVGGRIQHYFDRDWGQAEARHSRLVVIGQSGFDQAAAAAEIGDVSCIS